MQPAAPTIMQPAAPTIVQPAAPTIVPPAAPAIVQPPQAAPLPPYPEAHVGSVTTSMGPRTLNVQLNKFSGKESAVMWWTQFMAYIQLSRVSEGEAISSLLFFLTGTAQLWFANLEPFVKHIAAIYQAGIHDPVPAVL